MLWQVSAHVDPRLTIDWMLLPRPSWLGDVSFQATNPWKQRQLRAEHQLTFNHKHLTLSHVPARSLELSLQTNGQPYKLKILKTTPAIDNTTTPAHIHLTNTEHRNNATIPTFPPNPRLLLRPRRPLVPHQPPLLLPLQPNPAHQWPTLQNPAPAR